MVQQTLMPIKFERMELSAEDLVKFPLVCYTSNYKFKKEALS